MILNRFMSVLIAYEKLHEKLLATHNGQLIEKTGLADGG
jgi:hypothetical protein